MSESRYSGVAGGGAVITGVVLAGGQGRRMGGVDKGLQLLDGKPMAGWVSERLRPQVDALVINANQNIERYAAFGYPVISDQIIGFAGPLAGLHAALSQTSTPLVVTAPCDSPFLPSDLVARLHQALQAANAEVVVACAGGQLHPVFCLCRRNVLASLTDYLEAGQRKVELWLARHASVEVEFADVAAFRNINTADELRSHSSE
jgi:molybdenum cofactor guanylyltransferase